MLAFGIALAARHRRGRLRRRRDALALFGVGLGVWLIAGALSELAFRVKLGARAARRQPAAALAGLPRSAFGTTLAHAGLGLTVLGIVAATTWSSEIIRSMKPGDTATLAGYELTLDGFVNRDRPELQRDGGAVHRAPGRQHGRDRWSRPSAASPPRQRHDRIGDPRPSASPSSTCRSATSPPTAR